MSKLVLTWEIGSSHKKLDAGWDSKDIHQGCMSELNLIQGVFVTRSSPPSLSSTGKRFGNSGELFVFRLISPIPPLSEILVFLFLFYHFAGRHGLSLSLDRKSPRKGALTKVFGARLQMRI